MLIKPAEIKRNPRLLLQKPWLIAMVPYLFFQATKKRWKSDVQSIYLTETIIKNHPLMHMTPDSGFYVRQILNIDEAINLINKRITETAIDISYKKEVVRRLEKADYIVVLFQNEIPLSFLFVSENEIDLSQVGCNEQIPDKCFAVYDVYTFNQFRAKGYYSRLLSETMRFMGKKGYLRFWLWIMQHNQVSVLVHEKLKINRIISIYSECFRYGFRRFFRKDVEMLLSDLIR